MKVLAIGRHEILFSAIEYLLQNTNHEIVAIVTAKSRPEYQKREEDFRKLANTCGAKFYQTQKIDETVKQIVQEAGVEIGISFNWVCLIKEDFISLLPYGIINSHFGNLPCYRGNAVSNWAMLLGEENIVLTLHKMEPGELDAGDILLQKPFHVTQETTIREINQFAEDNIPGMFAEAIAGLENGSIIPKPQSQTGLQPFRCYPRLPQDGKINWHLPASQIHALVRSLVKPYSGAYTYYRTSQDSLEKLYIWKTKIISTSTQDIGVPGHIIKNDRETGDTWVYTGEGIIALSLISHGEEGEMFAPGKVWKSIRMRLGLDVEEEIYRIVRKLEA